MRGKHSDPETAAVAAAAAAAATQAAEAAALAGAAISAAIGARLSLYLHYRRVYIHKGCPSSPHQPHSTGHPQMVYQYFIKFAGGLLSVLPFQRSIGRHLHGVYIAPARRRLTTARRCVDTGPASILLYNGARGRLLVLFYF